MTLRKVTNLDELKELYDHSAMTWEGLRPEDFEVAMEECCKQGKDGDGYVISGNDMNVLCHLNGSNAYPADLNIFSIPKFKGLAIVYGARWMDDIIDNNARREDWHPFNED